MSKEDRQGARTVSDLERKYGSSFSDVYGIATDSREVAEDAYEAVDNLDKSLNQTELVNRLTLGGLSKAIYQVGDELYINASCINAGILDASLIEVINLIATILKSVDVAGNYVEIKDGNIMAGSGDTPHFALYKAFNEDCYQLDLSTVISDGSQVTSRLKWNELSLGGYTSGVPAFRVFAESSGNADVDTVKLKLPSTHYGESETLHAYWKSNGDGTFSLIGSKEELI